MKLEILPKSIFSLLRMRKPKVETGWRLIKANSQRFSNILTKGTKYICCGIEGKYSAKERGDKDVSYHLNLYAINDAGEEVLMTKDHIIPKSKDGKNDISNYQPMCVICNVKKGNKIQKG